MRARLVRSSARRRKSVASNAMPDGRDKIATMRVRNASNGAMRGNNSVSRGAPQLKIVKSVATPAS